MVRSDLGGGDEVVAGGASGVRAEPQSVEGLGIGGLSTMRNPDLVDSRSASILSTLVWTTYGSPAWKQSVRSPKRLRSAFTMTNRFAIVLKVIPWGHLKIRRSQLM